MPATVTLSTTTLTNGVDPANKEILLASNSGVRAGLFLFVDRELMRVEKVLDNGLVKVIRGQAGTPAQQHSSSAVVTIGTGVQFYSQDPVGSPQSAIAVSPWINVQNGTIWYAQGDSEPSGLTYRWWQDVTTTYSAGPLGIRVFASEPSSST